MEILREKSQDRKPYESPTVVYEAVLEVSAATTVSTIPAPGNDPFGLTGDK
jgi:hypothetical protein